jgi:putative flavoprotein involved in K+ transport
VVVVGRGQAGLAVGYFLAQQGRDFTILEAAAEPAWAWAWRERWDSLKLITPARYDALPGLAFPGDPGRYPGRDEVADYLTGYARQFDLPVELDSPVRAIRKSGARYLVELDDRTYEADQVVVATGPFQVPLVPAIAEGLDPAVVQMHSTEYRSPDAIPDGRVLAVGGGPSRYASTRSGWNTTRPDCPSTRCAAWLSTHCVPLRNRQLGRRVLHLLARMRTRLRSRSRPLHQPSLIP